MTSTSARAAALRLRGADGRVLSLPSDQWAGPPTEVDHRVLARADGPVLDVGCGPGRHLVALARAGVVTLGIDVSPPAVTLARARGAAVLHRSVFERVPGAGRWGTALLLDGNIGIGGDPALLLRRVATLLRPGGRILAELASGASGNTTGPVRLETSLGAGPWFGWTTVGEEALERVLPDALAVRETWADSGRCFARLDLRRPVTAR
jgi:SAM-dependent methyltransferase